MEVIQFTPSATFNFQFIAVLDGTQYSALVSWNYYGQRWYLSLTNATDGTLLVKRALIASPNNYDISLTSGYTATMIIFRESSQTFEIV